MNILAVDTCLEPGSLALSSEDASSSGDGRAAGEPEVVALPPGWRSGALHEEIRRLLARHSLTTANIDLYAVTTGPGTFTGIRLGLTVVKGLAEVHDKPVVPISTLEALAFAGNSRNYALFSIGKGRVEGRVPLSTHIAPVFDARRGQVFAAVYKVGQAAGIDVLDLLPVIPESVCSPQSFLNQIKASGIGVGPEYLRFCVTDEALLLPSIEEFGWTRDSLVRVLPQLAGTVAGMAAERFRKGKGIGALAANANYVRASDAELFWKE